MQKIKNEKGITLIVLVITLIVLVLISIPVIINTTDVTQLQRFVYLKNDIDKLREAIRTAYVDDLSITTIGPKYTGDMSFLEATQNGQDVKNPNDDNNYYVISIKELNTHINAQIDLRYGTGNKKEEYETIDGNYEYQGKDTYIINAQSKTIYYTNGIEYKGETYYRLPEDFTQISDVYVVSYDANGGENEPDMQTADTTGTATIRIRDAATKSGETFYGWKEKNGDNIYQPGETYVVKQDMELVALWENPNKGEDEGTDSGDNSKPEEVIIPEGFYYVGGTKEDGIVISDNKQDENKYKNITQLGTTQIPADGLVGNQFVWVPVENIDEFKRYPSYYIGTTQEITSYHEPSQEGYRYPNELEEYNAMMSSVEKNKGFYVARFEAGNENGKVVSKKGAIVWNNVRWGTSMTEIGTDGAVAKAKGMYTDKSTYGVTSTLIYGVQWDAIMSWIDPAYKTSTCDTSSSFVANSTGKGNYSGEIATCGSSDAYRLKNIYDLAGNVREWTLEAQSNNDRVDRGGYFNYVGIDSPASARNVNFPPDVSHSNVRFPCSPIFIKNITKKQK